MFVVEPDVTCETLLLIHLINLERGMAFAAWLGGLAEIPDLHTDSGWGRTSSKGAGDRAVGGESPTFVYLVEVEQR